MNKTSTVEIPIDPKIFASLTGSDEVEAYIKQLIEENENELSPIYDFYIEENDLGGFLTFASNSLNVFNIIIDSFSNLSGDLSISFQIEYYAGCDDVNTLLDNEHQDIVFEKEKDYLVLSFTAPLPWQNEAY